MRWIKHIVDGLIETYNTRNTYELIDALGVTLIRKKLPGDVKGQFLRNMHGDEFIFVSNELDEEEERLVVSHELGHVILHPDLPFSFYSSSLITANKLEVQANKFSAYLLIEDDMLDKIEYEGFTVDQIAMAENVPVSLLKLKFNIK